MTLTSPDELKALTNASTRGVQDGHDVRSTQTAHNVLDDILHLCTVVLAVGDA